MAYYFLNNPPPNPPNPETKLIKEYGDYEDSEYVYKIVAEVTNKGGDGWIKVFAEKKQYEQAETLHQNVYMKNSETQFVEFTFSSDPYVKVLPSAPPSTPTPTYDSDGPSPTAPPFTFRVWAEPE